MDEEYDVILLGTGITECVISGLLSVSGKKVLHVDRNEYYGGELATFNLEQLYKKFDKEAPKQYGRSRDWNVDICMKYIMAHSDLVGMFIQTGVLDYMQFKQIKGSFVMRNKKVYKVPVTKTEVALTGLLGLLEKKSMYNVVASLSKCDFEKNELPKPFTEKTTMEEVYIKYGVNENTRNLVGHVIALHQNDSYLKKSCLETFKRIDKYSTSLAKYGLSPYIYPLYGLSEIPQSFARLSAVYGGTYMLGADVNEVILDDEGKCSGVKIGEKIVKAKIVVGDPSYFKSRTKQVGRIIRCICILSNPVKLVNEISDCQIIIPCSQANRSSDIYVGIISKSTEACPEGFYIALVTANIENPDNPELDIKPGLDLLGKIDEKFIFTSDVYHPTDDGATSNIFISKSYDATTHFDTATEDINDMYMRITGERLDQSELNKKVKSYQATAAAASSQ